MGEKIQRVKVSDYIAEFVSDIGVKDVFMITGGGAMHLNESFGNSAKLKYYCNHHEQASAMAAEGYARLKGLGVVVVTTGPGGLNALNGVAGAWLDSIPLLVISGQVKREIMVPKGSSLRQIGSQELNIVSIVKPMTKYAALVDDPLQIRYHLEKAVFLAKSGRPGPVWLDIPLDIQASIIDRKLLKGFDSKSENSSGNEKDLKKAVKKVIELLKKSNRPVILAGGGVRLSNSQNDLLYLVKKLHIPVTTTITANDLVPTNNDLFFGRPGALGGERVGNFVVQNCDLLISIGVRHHLLTIGYDYKNFARAAKKVAVDIDPAELDKPTFRPDLPINADASDFIKTMLKQVDNIKLPKCQDWIKYCQKIKKKYPMTLPEYKNQKNYVNSYYFIDVLSDLLPENQVIVTSDGTALTCTAQSINIKRGQRLICNNGCASMGYGLPAAIGACIANNNKPTICLEGDGSLQLNIQELQTVVHHKLPLKIFVFNNDGYLAIRITQGAFFKGHYVGSSPESGVSFPDLKKLSQAYGLQFMRLKNQKNLKENLKKVVNSKGPFLCEVMMDPKQSLIPKVTSVMRPDGKMISKPLEDMFPFLPRKEFYENMIIKPLNED